MTAVTCSSCYTRYVPPPRAETAYEKACPECRDKARHTAVETDLISDIAQETFMDRAMDAISSVFTSDSSSSDSSSSYDGGGGDFSGGGSSGGWGD